MSGTNDQGWTLYRFTHADGSAKDWAWRRLPTGGAEVAWGRLGQPAQRRVYGPRDAARIAQRAHAKERKGYVVLGDAVLRRGALMPLPRAPFSQAPSRPLPATAPAHAPSTPAVDLSRLLAEQDDFWF